MTGEGSATMRSM